jgi:hypothetical protein
MYVYEDIPTVASQVSVETPHRRFIDHTINVSKWMSNRLFNSIFDSDIARTQKYFIQELLKSPVKQKCYSMVVVRKMISDERKRHNLSNVKHNNCQEVNKLDKRQRNVQI